MIIADRAKKKEFVDKDEFILKPLINTHYNNIMCPSLELNKSQYAYFPLVLVHINIPIETLYLDMVIVVFSVA